MAILYSLPLSSYVEVRLEPLPGSGKEPAGIRMTQKNEAITTTLTTVVPGTPPDPPLKNGEEVVHFKMFYELNGVPPREQVRLIYRPVDGAVGTASPARQRMPAGSLLLTSASVSLRRCHEQAGPRAPRRPRVEKLELGLPQRVGCRTARSVGVVKPDREVARVPVLEFPQRADDRGHAGDQERPCQRDRPFAAQERADTRLATAQDDETDTTQVEPAELLEIDLIGAVAKDEPRPPG